MEQIVNLTKFLGKTEPAKESFKEASSRSLFWCQVSLPECIVL